MDSKAVCTLILVLLDLGLIYGQQQQNQCYRGLFVPEERAETMVTKWLSFQKMYKLSSYEKLVNHVEACGYHTTTDSTGQVATLRQCRTNTYENAVTGTCQSCCQTEMSFSAPQNVTDVFQGTQYQAKHDTNSYQLLHLGTCMNEGAACHYGGKCEQAMRMELVLVELPSGTEFLPTYVPSHCTCTYA